MSFARSLFTVSGLTMVSRLAGFVRDTLTATFLGADSVADAFFAAQRLPNLFRSLFAEGAFTAAFVPLYTTEQERHGQEVAQAFAGQALMVLLAGLLPFSVLVMLCMPQVMFLLAPGFESDPEKFQLAVNFCTITFPYLALISVTALQTGVLNAQGRFGPGAAAPIAFNLVLIIGLLVAHYGHIDIGYTLAWSVTISGVVQMLWLMLSCYRAGVSIPLVKPHLGEVSRRLFRRIGPGAIGAGAAQINFVVSTNLASKLPSGSVAYLFYADRLNQLPLGIVGIAVATTLLPLLSRHIDAGRHDHARHYMGRAIEFCLMLGLPATIGLALAAQPIIQTLFEHGHFTHADTVQTAVTLAAYSLGIPAFLLVKTFAAGFFARQDTATPVKIALVAMAVNVAGSILFKDIFGITGIALANSLAVWVNACLLFVFLRRRAGKLGDKKLRQRVPRLMLSAGVMAVATWFLVYLTSGKFLGHDLLQQGIALTAIILGSSLLYMVFLQATGAIKLQELRQLLKRAPVTPELIEEEP